MPKKAAAPEEERISKIISRAGLASRREAERLMEDGLVELNGETVYHPGTTAVATKDTIKVRGAELPAPPPLVYFAGFKPRGLVTTRDDPQGRRTVMEMVEGLSIRVEPVGRLDLQTEGLLLFTNDGDLAHKLTHPSTQVPKRYHVKVWKEPDDRGMRRLRNGVHLDDGKTQPAKARIIETTDSGNVWLEITVTEGRNRLIRRMLEAVGHPVSKLRRVSFGTIGLGKLQRGQVRPLSTDEVRRLQDIAAGRKPEQAGRSRYKKGYARPKPPKTRPLGKKKAAQRKKRRS